MSTVRLDDANIPVASTIVGLTVTGVQGGQVVQVPPSLLKGNKGDPGDPLTFPDLTPEEIAILQQPATDMIADVNLAIGEANTATQAANTAAGAAQTQADRVSAITVLTSAAVTDVTEYNEVVI